MPQPVRPALRILVSADYSPEEARETAVGLLNATHDDLSRDGLGGNERHRAAPASSIHWQKNLREQTASLWATRATASGSHWRRALCPRAWRRPAGTRLAGQGGLVGV
jgi:hypothetical protein